MVKQVEDRQALPPYIPFKTLTGFLQKLKDTTVPPRVDSSLMRTYSGSAARQLVAAMKWMGLIDENGYTREVLRNLVAAYGSPTWSNIFGDALVTAYEGVIGDLDLDHATPGMLADKFRATGADGQVLQKCITFYLNAMRNAGWTFSPHLADKTPRLRGERRGHAKRQAIDEGTPNGGGTPTEGMVRFSFPIPDKSAATIILPADLTEDDWSMVSSMIGAYIRRKSGK